MKKLICPYMRMMAGGVKHDLFSEKFQKIAKAAC